MTQSLVQAIYLVVIGDDTAMEVRAPVPRRLDDEPEADIAVQGSVESTLHPSADVLGEAPRIAIRFNNQAGPEVQRQGEATEFVHRPVIAEGTYYLGGVFP